MDTCQDFNEYETARFVTYHDIVLYKDREYPKLSTYRVGYIDAIKKEMDAWLLPRT